MQSEQHNYNTVIVGGGYSGIALCMQLLKNAPPSHKILLIYNQSPIAAGVAYSTNEPCHLLNVPAGKMSAFADSPDDLVDWLIEQEPHKAQDTELSNQFIPRMNYRAYLQSRFEACKNQAVCQFEMLFGTVKHVERTNGTYTLKLDDKTITTPNLVLALGNAKPFNLLETFDIPEDCPNYLSNPWQFENLTSIQDTQDILIIGTGLTTVDILLSLYQRNYSGNITLFSRHGLLPKVHRLGESIPPEAYNHNFHTLKSSLHYVKSLVKAQNQEWRKVIDSLRPITQQIWSNWSESDKSAFMAKVRPYWDVLRHRIAPEVNDIIQKMLIKQVKVYSGRLSQATKTNHGFNLSIESNQDTISLKSDVVINATGPNYISYEKHPIVQSLITQNLASWDTFKLGFKTNNNSLLLDPKTEKPNDGLYAIGPITKSTFWEIIAVPDIRAQVKNISDFLLTSVKA